MAANVLTTFAAASVSGGPAPVSAPRRVTAAANEMHAIIQCQKMAKPLTALVGSTAVSRLIVILDFMLEERSQRINLTAQ